VRRNILLLFLFAFWLQPAWAQNRTTTLGWDLTYRSVLAKNKVGKKEWIRKWLAEERQTPATIWVSQWEKKSIFSAILIEFPAFHAAERTTMLFVRTKTGAHYWDAVQSTPPHLNNRDLNPEIYDNFFKFASSWHQNKSLSQKDIPKDAIPGFMGILSVYEGGKSRQMLLTMEDFISLESKDDKDKRGRLMCALAPVLNKNESDNMPECNEQP